MSLSVGIVGLPNVGKSTLFKALTKQPVDIANYPFCTVEPNVGIVPVPDDRLTALTKLSKSEKTVPTVIEFVDIAGLVKGAHKGEGLGNQFLANIREVDAIIHTVRAFENKDITHVSETIDPTRDITTIQTELTLADIQLAEKALPKLQSDAKGKDKEAESQVALLEKILASLNKNIPINSIELEKEEKKYFKRFQFLTAKPMIIIANITEEDIRSTPKIVNNIAQDVGDIIPLSLKIESEIVELAKKDQQTYLKELGLDESGLSTVIRRCYKLLGLITFFTTGPKETRAWTVRKGASAQKAAGVIHTDFARGFIRAETINWKDLVRAGSEPAARTKGLLRDEGKEYLVRDGDVMHFKFNV